MASMSQCRALAGCRAFTVARPGTARRAAASNGSKYFMRKKDSYMVEVQVGEDEPEDSAVRRFMKQVVDSRVVEQVRARKLMETKIEKYKREKKERIELRKAGWVEPTWEQMYGLDPEPKPFDDFFDRDEEAMYDDGIGGGLAGTLGGLGGDDIFNDTSYTDGYGASLGGYVDNRVPSAGGYINGPGSNQGGGYINQGNNTNPNQGGGYISDPFSQGGGYQQSAPAAGGYMQ